MNRYRLLLIAVCSLLWIAPASAGNRPVVVELFTSEGCSSCPPADALLSELAARPEVLALSFHVDYWDRLGWKDPFSSPAATQRQSRYAELLGLAAVYTPQIVIDGKWQAVGSSRAEVERILDLALRDRDGIPVGIAVDHGRAQITFGAGGDRMPASVVLIGFDRHQVTPVARGENAGRTLTHVDVVRSIEEVAWFTGRPDLVETPLPPRCDRIAAIVQAQDGRILGVAVRDADAR
jgi:hypothetical protein